MENMEETLDIYTTLEEAKEEIWRRWNDQKLRRKVEDYLGGDIPAPFRREPRAVLVRNIISPDIEFRHFLNQAQRVGLKPLGLEGADDKFSTASSDKVGLAKMAFFKGYDKSKNPRISCQKIIDIPKNDGKKFKEIRTLWGENLIDFHHRLLEKHSPEKIEIFDDLQWAQSNGLKTAAKDYYQIILAFFISHGILFENFMAHGSENDFTNNIFLPAFSKMIGIFGCKPLIIPAIPEDKLGNKEWWCYPEEAEEYILPNAVL